MAASRMLVVCVALLVAVACGSGGGERRPAACDEPRWGELCALVVDAGYRVAGSTGSALVVEGRGASFYVWTTAAPPGRRRESGMSVADVRVHGDGVVWRFWRARGRMFWLQAGPTRSARLPARAGLERLVAVSLRRRPADPDG